MDTTTRPASGSDQQPAGDMQPPVQYGPAPPAQPGAGQPHHPGHHQPHPQPGGHLPPGPARVSLLAYEQQVVGELVEEDGLVVLAAGLGLQRLLAVLMRIHHHMQEGVLLVLGMPSWQREVVAAELHRHDPAVPPPVDVNNEVPATERIQLYRSHGAVLVITPRILVVDLLTKRVEPQQIAGLVVLNAHRVHDASGEAFAVRLYRAGNTRGHVRALSDCPTAFTGGFNKVEKVMRALHVRRLCLWPRFRDEVAEVMQAGRPDVVEWGQELPRTMLMIQAAVTEVTESLIKDLRRTHKVDCSGLDASQLGSGRNLSESLRRQLEPVWNSVGWKTRQIIKDLRTLRDVCDHLVHCDAITFLAYLESLRLSAGSRSVWLFHDAAHTVYEQARRRVYLFRAVAPSPAAPPAATGPQASATASPSAAAPAAAAAVAAAAARAAGSGTAAGGRKRKASGGGARGGGTGAAGGRGAGAGGAAGGVAGGGVEPVLEEVPKWELLRKVLTEVQARRTALQAAQPGQPDPLHALTLPHVVGVDPEEMDTGDTAAPQQHPAAAAAGPALSSGGGPSASAAASNTLAPAASSRRSAPEVVILSDTDDDDQQQGQGQGQHQGGVGVGGQVAAGAGGRVMQGGGAPAPAPAAVGPSEEVVVEVMDEESAAACRRVGRACVVVVSRELHSCSQLEGVMREGGRAVMQAAYEAYLLRAEAAKKGGGSKGRGAWVWRESGGDEAAGGRGRGRKGKGRGSGGDAAPGAGAVTVGRSPALLRPGEASALEAEAQRLAALQDGVVAEDPLLAGVHFCSLDAHCEGVLWRVQPGTVVMYEPDLAFLRQVEVYAADHPELAVQVHVMSYQDSVEHAAFLAAVDKEVNVFTNLIEFKQHIVIPEGPPPAPPNQLLPRGAAALDADAWLDVYQQNTLTRVAGRGAAGKSAPRRLVVDVREFMSSLPCVLHQQGFELFPVTLEVGDYVLSPTMCVERKAVPDLISSLASGRLYSQAEAMCKHYKSPVLLIEFDANKTFGLQSASELGDDIDGKTVGSRLVLLLTHFPRLRLVWSRSLHATADMFASLKSNMDEPDVITAQAVGLPPEATVGGQPVVDAAVNAPAVELLKRLPGITDANARLIMSSVTNLAELATTPLERLEAIMCSQRNARLLHDFLHAPCPKP